MAGYTSNLMYNHLMTSSRDSHCVSQHPLSSSLVHANPSLPSFILLFVERKQQTAGISGLKSFTIQSVKDVRRAEDVSVAEAIARGILDKRKQHYRNTVTGEMISLDQAVRRS